MKLTLFATLLSFSVISQLPDNVKQLDKPLLMENIDYSFLIGDYDSTINYLFRPIGLNYKQNKDTLIINCHYNSENIHQLEIFSLIKTDTVLLNKLNFDAILGPDMTTLYNGSFNIFRKSLIDSVSKEEFTKENQFSVSSNSLTNPKYKATCYFFKVFLYDQDENKIFKSYGNTLPPEFIEYIIDTEINTLLKFSLQYNIKFGTTTMMKIDEIEFILVE